MVFVRMDGGKLVRAEFIEMIQGTTDIEVSSDTSVKDKKTETCIVRTVSGKEYRFIGTEEKLLSVMGMRKIR